MTLHSAPKEDTMAEADWEDGQAGQERRTARGAADSAPTARDVTDT